MVEAAKPPISEHPFGAAFRVHRAACIRGPVRRWNFPDPDAGGTVIVTYPFVL